jgi:hypothetical protein
MVGTDREAWMRFKPDGALDEVWRRPAPPSTRQPGLPRELRDETLIADMLRNHPGMTREEAQQMLDLFG